MEASGPARWFERLMAELQFELRIGDAAEIRTKRVRKQKTDRRTTDSALAAGRSLPADLGTELGEPRSAATAVASASHGAGAHANHEPTASRGVERRSALQKEVVARTRTAATGVVPPGSVGHAAAARSAGVTGSTDADDRGAKTSD